MIRRAFASALPANGLPGRPAAVVGSMRKMAPSSPAESPVVRMSWLRRAPPSALGGDIAPPGGSLHGFTGVGGGLPVVPPNCPQSPWLKSAPSPALTYSAPPGPNMTVPIEWLGNWLHQSSRRTCSAGPIVVPLTANRDSRPLTTQPSVVAPGGAGHVSPQRGAPPPLPRMWSYVYST